MAISISGNASHKKRKLKILLAGILLAVSWTGTTKYALRLNLGDPGRGLLEAVAGSVDDPQRLSEIDRIMSGITENASAMVFSKDISEFC